MKNMGIRISIDKPINNLGIVSGRKAAANMQNDTLRRLKETQFFTLSLGSLQLSMLVKLL